MNWTEIIIAIIGSSAITGFAVRLITLKSTKIKADAEAEGAKIANESNTVETLKAAMGMLNEQLEVYNKAIADKNASIAEKNALIEKYVIRLTALYDDMCVHKGCKLRKPHQGQGSRWYDEHSDDPSLGCDYCSVEELLDNWNRNASKIISKASSNK